jgi:hypothetical protein
MSVLGPAEGIAYILATLQATNAVTSIATGGIFRGVAPQSSINTPPYILINYQGGADVMGSFADRLFTTGLYQVAIYGPDPLVETALVAGAQAIDAALHRTKGTAAGGIILAAYREQPLMLSEVISGSDVMWTRCGGLYRLLVQ